MTLIELSFWALAILWSLFSLLQWLSIGRIEYLPAAAPGATPTTALPRVSVVICARNEEKRIEQTVLRLLQQTGIDLELLVVDDRSSDRTPAILRDLAEGESRLEIVTVENLPPGWLGKSYACHLAAERASGEWILFSDADVWMRPDVIARAVGAANAAGADHVTLVPGEERTTIGGGAVMVHLVVFFAYGFARVNRDLKNAFSGSGAFNLVSAAAYRRIGGHLPLRMEVIDDVCLGMLLNWAGFRTRLYGATQDLEVSWCSSVPALIRVLEKNLFSLLRFKWPLAVVVICLQLALYGVPLLGPLSGTLGGYAALLGWASLTLPGLRAARKMGIGTLSALLSPLMFPVPAAALLNSSFKALRQGGIYWRETFYSLDALRRGYCTRSRISDRS